MTDLQLLLKLLGRQKQKGVTRGDWTKLTPDITRRPVDGTTVNLPSVEMGFSFDCRGNFIGIFNYKE